MLPMKYITLIFKSPNSTSPWKMVRSHAENAHAYEMLASSLPNNNRHKQCNSSSRRLYVAQNIADKCFEHQALAPLVCCCCCCMQNGIAICNSMNAVCTRENVCRYADHSDLMLFVVAVVFYSYDKANLRWMVERPKIPLQINTISHVLVPIIKKIVASGIPYHFHFNFQQLFLGFAFDFFGG